MNKFSTKLFSGLVALSLAAFSNVNAQFADANLPENSVGISPIFANNTGNDIVEYSGNMCGVSVWDDMNGTNAGISWNIGPWSGFDFLDPSLMPLDPDVVLVKSGVNMWALVVYYAQSTQEFVLEKFQYDGGGHIFYSIGVTPLGNGMLNSTINIDANDIGEFVIVWDEPGNNVNLVSGTTNGTPQLASGGAVFNIEPGRSPDVAIFRNPASGDNQANVVYIANNNRISVDSYRISDLQNNAVQLTPMLRAPAPDLQYRYPRIASPSSNLGSNIDFTVVTEDTDGASTWYIKGFNSNGCCNPNVTLSIYNDGSTLNSPWNTTDIPNNRPVVCYDNGYTSIWTAWTLDNSIGTLPAPGAAYAKAPVALILSRKGEVVLSQSYKYVPSGISTGTDVSNVSLSGRQVSTNFFTYLKSNTNSVYSKFVDQQPWPNDFRPAASGSVTTWLDQTYLNNSSNQLYTLNVYNLAGQQIFSKQADPADLKTALLDFRKTGMAGIYMVTVQSADGTDTFNGKYAVTGSN